MILTAAQLAVELKLNPTYVYMNARALGGERDETGCWVFNLAEAQRRLARR